MKHKAYEKELRRLQAQLCMLQDWVKQEGVRVVVVFEGRDAADKGMTPPSHEREGPRGTVRATLARRMRLSPALSLRALILASLAGLALAGCQSEEEKRARRIQETRECAGCDLRRLSLEGADLEGARLVGARLEGAKLGRARLKGADLSEVDLTLADLRGADLRGARLDETFLEQAQLQGANLEGVDLRSARAVESAHFEGAILRGINLEEESFSGPGGPHRRSERSHAYSVPVGGALLSGVDLRGAKLRGAVLERCDLAGADLRDADLRDAKLKNANLAGVKLEGANLSGATWEDGRQCAAGSMGECRPPRK
ncbi:pentapeptide repeat-containing protein [Myxococcus virescens]|uniref:pentapeptide repeat-containing protein n=1 Tax=Myxococcus virescens TaxID=83456 RepID=UPI003DA435A4